MACLAYKNPGKYAWDLGIYWGNASPPPANPKLNELAGRTGSIASMIKEEAACLCQEDPAHLDRCQGHIIS